MSEWQPIETAPKDGTKVLVTGCNGFSKVIAACYLKEWELEERTKTGWFGWLWPTTCAWLAEPSHWMPFPEPPNKKAVGDGRVAR